MFRVDPKTVTRWAKDGKLTSVRTLGGHRRYPEAEVRACSTRSAAPRGRERRRRAGSVRTSTVVSPRPLQLDVAVPP